MREIQLSQGKVALVDDEDYELINAYRWWLVNGYAYRSFAALGQRSYFYMHRLVMDVFPNEMVDHINHNTLDNRKSNLRVVNDQQNIANSRPYGRSGFKGVFAVAGHKGAYKNGGNPWRAQINQRGKTVYLGSHPTEEAAARAYNKAAKEYFGEYAWLNPVPAE